MAIVKSLLVKLSPLARKISDTADTQTPITFRMWVMQKVLGFNRNVPWPTHFTSVVQHYSKIDIGVETSPGYMPGCYIQGRGGIKIGDYTQIAPNVGIISSNHNVCDNRLAEVKGPITIGSYCWLGMGSKILSGVTLGDFTTVAANTVVTKSYPDGYCVLAGVPAKVVKRLDPSQCVRHRSPIEYCGYRKR